MSDIIYSLIKEKVEQKLFNPAINCEQQGSDNQILFSNKQMMFEQYKTLVESAHKIEERRGGSNNFFVSINTIFLSFILVNPLKLPDIELQHMPLLALLILVGILIAWDWLRVMNSYKKLNLINYALIRTLEKTLPTFIFTLRGEIEAEEADQKPSNRANIILLKENILPKAFIFIYSIYFLTILYLSYRKY